MLAVLERAHRRLLLGGLHPPVDQADAGIRQGRLQGLEGGLRGLRLDSSESSISVHTQYAWRPSAQAADALDQFRRGARR
jgi:hypothetical protein